LIVFLHCSRNATKSQYFAVDPGLRPPSRKYGSLGFLPVGDWRKVIRRLNCKLQTKWAEIDHIESVLLVNKNNNVTA
jgi:hypothetical protein